MASKVQQQWQFAQRVKRELQNKLKEKDSLLGDIENLIQQCRIACETTIFLDFDYAVAEGVDTSLWDTHGMINNRYRKIVARFKSEEYKKHVVEKRKWDKRYADFLKTSQYYYKGYIQRLASHFDGLDDLYKIAHRLDLSTLTADERVKVTPDTAHKILLSCHSALLHLGDLCRYRNVLRMKDRSWESAMTHYGLAHDLYPDAGDAFNQMAVIAQLDGDHLGAIFYLYRALAVNKPFAMAEGNLSLEFKKITTEWTTGNRKSGSTSAGQNGKDAAAPTIRWFTRLHAKLYKGQEFAGYDELENEVLSQMAVLLRKQSLDEDLDKIVLINMAAEYFAGVRLRGSPTDDNFQAYRFFLRLNVRMMSMFLHLLQPELGSAASESSVPDVTGKTDKSKGESITPVTRRVLPVLRQYSIWLVARAPLLVTEAEQGELYNYIKEMWTLYASTLSLLTLTFPLDQLPTLDYLLDEDAATVGFKPFRDSELCTLYTNDNGQLKARVTDPGVKQELPNVEMQARVRDLLKDGMQLVVDENYPVYLINGGFRYQEDGSPLSDGVNGASQALPATNANANLIQQQSSFRSPQTIPESSRILRPPSVAISDSLSTDMYQMVDNLVSSSLGSRVENTRLSNETSYGMHSNTARDVFGFVRNTPPQEMPHRAAIFPSIPGLPGQNSAFSPQPGELEMPNFERPSTATRLAALQLTENSSACSSPNSFGNDSMQGNKMRNAWGVGIAPASSSPFLPKLNNVGQQIQQSLEQEYLSSSDFSHSSSIYQGTPYLGGPNFGQHVGPNGYNFARNANTYVQANDYDRAVQLQSSIWNGSQPLRRTPGPTPPGGQGG